MDPHDSPELLAEEDRGAHQALGVALDRQSPSAIGHGQRHPSKMLLLVYVTDLSRGKYGGQTYQEREKGDPIEVFDTSVNPAVALAGLCREDVALRGAVLGAADILGATISRAPTEEIPR